MEIDMTLEKLTWADAQGTSYETRFHYTGFGRIDTHAKLYQVFQSNTLFERPFLGGVVSRLYASEYATVTEYSKSPRRWKEDTGIPKYFSERPRPKTT